MLSFVLVILAALVLSYPISASSIVNLSFSGVVQQSISPDIPVGTPFEITGVLYKSGVVRADRPFARSGYYVGSKKSDLSIGNTSYGYQLAPFDIFDNYPTSSGGTIDRIVWYNAGGPQLERTPPAGVLHHSILVEFVSENSDFIDLPQPISPSWSEIPALDQWGLALLHINRVYQGSCGRYGCGTKAEEIAIGEITSVTAIQTVPEPSGTALTTVSLVALCTFWYGRSRALHEIKTKTVR